jgi:Pilus assembly protein, PilO./General secretion pathway, M protein.
MSNLNKSERILLSILAVVFIGYLYYTFLLSPELKKIQATQSNIDQYTKELNELKLLSASNKKLGETLNELKLKLDQSNGTLPKGDRSPEVQRETKKIVDNTKVILSGVVIGNGVEYNLNTNTNANAQKTGESKTDNKEAAKTTAPVVSTVKTMMLPVTLNVSGDYSSIMNFMKAFEESKRLTEINTVVIAPKGTKTGDGQLTLTLNSNVYYIDDGTAVQPQFDFNNGSYSKDNLFK